MSKIKKIIFTFIIGGLFLIFSGEFSSPTLEFGLYNGGEPLIFDGERAYAPGQVVVKFAGENPKTAGLNSKGTGHTAADRVLRHKYRSEIKAVNKDRYSDYYIVETHKNCALEAFREKLRRDPSIAAAELNYYAHIAATPDDPYFAYQYALDNQGQVYVPNIGLRGRGDSDIDAPEGWDWTTGSGDVIIAIIDTGAAPHEDLVNKLVPGYNFIADNTNTADDNGHGTFVASIAAAETGNGTGMAGVDWNAKIMPLKCVASDGLASYTVLAAGIRYAADSGAKVINLSLGGAYPSFVLEDACSYAFGKGCVIVAAAGNQGGQVLYPAAYDDYVLAIAATDSYDNRLGWSNYGPQVDVAAPGQYVFGAIYFPDEPDVFNAYGWGSGTSFSTPYAAGAAALLMGYKPSLANDVVMKIIKYTADDVNRDVYPGVDDFIGYGRINIGRLLGAYELN
ncbi:MAG: S8 family serine peptidase [Candidatus Aminicenantes bacterium]|nr:S8 family serine peptidase [Candidatus Aminicenantes bacterium]